MMTSPVEEIKSRLDIVQVVKEYLKLQKAGANYRALCPFHAEKSPSFFVSPGRQMFHCFGCSVSGDVFSFVMQIEGLEFGDALRQLAQKAGVELQKRDPSFQRMQSQRKRLAEAAELAAKFFEKQLGSPTGQAAKTYLLGRQVSEESLSSWRIGYAPDTKRSLLDFLLDKGFTEREVGQAGLSVNTEEGAFDRFRSRIMFPVFSLQGEVIGFGGRIFGKEGKDLAKYVNVPSTLLYDKSRVLYGIDKAKLEMRKADTCVLVEGYMDTIMAHQAGTSNAVATSGTALTQLHLQLLKRYSDNLILAFDMDSAGDSATKRSIELALAQGFHIKIVRAKEGKDPAETAAASGEAWREAVESASSIMDYYFDSAFAEHDKRTAEGKRKASDLLLRVIAKLPNKIEQSHWVSRLAEEIGVKEEAVHEELGKVKAEPGERAESSLVKETGPERKGRRELIEERILTLLFKNPENREKLKEQDIAQMSLKTKELTYGLIKAENLEFSSLKEVFSGETLEKAKHIALLADLEEETEGMEDEFNLCVKSLLVFSLKERLEEIIGEIREAESAKEQSRIDLLLQEFHAITKELQSA